MNHKITNLVSYINFCARLFAIGFLSLGSGTASAQQYETEDAARFAQLLRQDKHKDSDYLQQNYLHKASNGLKAIQHRIVSAENLAQTIQQNQSDYQKAIDVCLPAALAVKQQALDIVEKVAIGVNVNRVQNISIVFGVKNVAATASPNSIIIALEVVCQQVDNIEQAKTSILEYIAHEMVHVAQYQLSKRKTFDFTLLEMSLIEGTADFISEMFLDAAPTLQLAREAWGEHHAEQLLKNFIEQMHTHDYTNWLYSPTKANEPADMGYWMGKQIARLYYDRTEDKEMAIRSLLEMTDATAIFHQSKWEH